MQYKYAENFGTHIITTFLRNVRFATSLFGVSVEVKLLCTNLVIRIGF